jgi:hypothetical protein
MSSTSAVMASPAPRAAWQKDFGLALLATLIALAVNAIGGFQSLSSASDNDSLLRLVEVRDLLAGQGWFDLHQYRLGPEGGLVMHWSRLVDAPIAAIILTAGETAARLAWPALTFCLSLFFTVRAARRLGGDSAVLPALVAGATSLHFLGIFSPGALDHHNIQLMLTLASVAFLLAAPQQKAAAALSGICAALTLVIGMETAPYVAIIGVCVAGLFVFGADSEKTVARDYGLGFAGTSTLVLIAVVPVSEWGQAQCDAFSVTQFAVAAMAGGGLAAIASVQFTSRNRVRRVVALGVLGAAIGVVMLRWFPECLAAPYAELDSRLREYWLDHISEAQSLFQLIEQKDATVAARYGTPLIAIVLMGLRLRNGGWRRQDYVVGAVLVAAFLASIWQVRGSTFSVAFAVLPLSVWIGRWRLRAQANPTTMISLKMVAVWLVSLNAVWVSVAAVAATALEDKPKAETGSIAVADCAVAEDFAALSAQPDTTVLAPSNLGSPILLYSRHRALAGPYHRNVAGNLVALNALMGSPDEAKALIEANHVGLVAVCPGNAENKILVDGAPDGFLAQLLRGSVPAWLEPVTETQEKPLELYRVR